MACSVNSLTVSLASKYEALLFSPLLSDVTLVVDGTHRIPAHKLILTACSDYFRSLFLIGMVESAADEVKFDVVSVESGRELLRYLYTGRLREVADIQDPELLLNLLKDAHFHALQPLVLQVADTLGVRLSLETVVAVYQTAKLFELKALSYTALTFMDTHAAELMTHPTFLDLTQIQLKIVLGGDFLYADEKDILGGAMRWLENYQSQHKNKTDEEMQLVADDVLSRVRFQLMTAEELLGVIRGLTQPQQGLLVRHKVDRESGAVALPREHTQIFFRNDAVEYKSVNMILVAGCNWRVTRDASGRNNSWTPTTDEQTLVLKLPRTNIISEIFLQCISTTSFYVETSSQEGAGGEEWTRPCPLTEVQEGVVCHLKFLPRPVRTVRVFVEQGGVFAGTFRLKHDLV